ncbi:MAG: T9SS type A sorting domain-containing protein [Bacteroidia bacterium]
MKTKLLVLLTVFSCFAQFSFGQIPVPFNDNFDGVNQGWFCVTDSGSSWELGTPTYGTTNSTHSGINCWDLNLDSAYHSPSSTKLYSPLFDFSGASGMNISFWINMNVEGVWDGTRLEYSINGSNWNVLGAFNEDSTYRWYNYDSLNSSGLPGWASNSSGWKKCAHSLSFLNNTAGSVQFRFVFTADLSVSHDGVSIDDFAIDTTSVPLYYPVSINIATANISPAPCYNLPFNVPFNISGQAENFNANQSLTVNINWGDGTDTAYIIAAGNNTFSTSPSHIYTSAGIYSLQYIVIPPGGLADTLIKYNQVNLQDTCSDLSGKVYFDVDSDCVYTVGIDTVFKKFDVFLDNGLFPTMTSTDNSGNYLFRTIGNNAVSIDSTTAAFCPANNQYNISVLPSHNNNFALQAVNGFNLKTTIPFGSITTGFMGDVWVSVKNLGYNNVSGQLLVNLPSGITFVDTLGDHPDTIINSNTLVYNFLSLGFNNPVMMQIFFIADSTLLPTQQLCFTAIATPVTGDLDASNNEFTWCEYPSTSFDPNEKHVNPIGAIPNDTVLRYSIAFQNTGTAPAHNIYILDTISDNLDLSTFNFIASSHLAQYQLLPGNVIRFSFSNIMLPDSGNNQILSHGYVTYSIRPKHNLANGTAIANSAAILFDFNEPVITNTTLNFIDSTLIASVNDIKMQQHNFAVYPNPFSSSITIENKMNLNGAFSFELSDMIGRKVITLNKNSGTISIPVSQISSGLYFYKITESMTKAVQFGKLIKQ